MKDKYLSFKYDAVDKEWLKAIPSEVGILIAIQYHACICYFISTTSKNGIYHRLDGPAIVYKENNEFISDQYWVYGKILGSVTDTTFEEFEIKRDKLLKEMIFQ